MADTGIDDVKKQKNAVIFRTTLVTAQVSDVTPGPLTVTDTSFKFRLTNFDASRHVTLHMRYVSTFVRARVVGGVGKQ
jgi:tryptophan synthase beta subunit